MAEEPRGRQTAAGCRTVGRSDRGEVRSLLVHAGGLVVAVLGARVAVGRAAALGCSRRGGARGVLVRTGKGASQEAALARLTWTGTTVVDDIGDAASLILEAR